jgi:hypothetical protein
MSTDTKAAKRKTPTKVQYFAGDIVSVSCCKNKLVEHRGFEPRTSCVRCRRASRTAPMPHIWQCIISAWPPRDKPGCIRL